jgi:hypothetical protein
MGPAQHQRLDANTEQFNEQVRTEAEVGVVKEIELLSLCESEVAVLPPPQLRKVLHCVCSVGKVEIVEGIVRCSEPAQRAGHLHPPPEKESDNACFQAEALLAVILPDCSSQSVQLVVLQRSCRTARFPFGCADRLRIEVGKPKSAEKGTVFL